MISGPVFAIVTPFSEGGEIDFDALGRYLSFLHVRGVRNIVTNGTTAEFPSLTMKERVELLAYCRENFRGTIINNVGSCCLKISRRLAQDSGGKADYILLPPPFYYAEPDERGVGDFFKEVLSVSPVPVFLYNFPRHTQFRILPEFVSELLESFDNIVGIKDSEGVIDRSEMFTRVKNGFLVYVGSDSRMYETLARGMAGSVSGSGNAFPEHVLDLHKCFVEGNVSEAGRLQTRLVKWSTFVNGLGGSSLAATKHVLSLRIDSFPTAVRPPHTALTEAEAGRVSLGVSDILARLI